jgi:hypothetical protein
MISTGAWEGVSGEVRSGAQTLAATRAAGGENLAAAGGRETGTEAVTALAHQFAGLIGPLHGRSPLPKSSSDGLVEGNSPINEMKSCDVGPEVDLFRSKMNRPGRAGPSRTVGAAYTGVVCFRQSWGLVWRFSRTAPLRA